MSSPESLAEIYTLSDHKSQTISTISTTAKIQNCQKINILSVYEQVNLGQDFIEFDVDSWNSHHASPATKFHLDISLKSKAYWRKYLPKG